jgi:serine-type D-Ala-D-Ala carboxypeptidase (penicillin-binding protein 5/6)
MWEKLLSSLLATLLPASILAAAPSTVDEDILLSVHQPAIRLVQEGPEVLAQSALIMEMDSSEILYAKNAEVSLPVASLTKLMTALVVIESADIHSLVEVSKRATGVYGAQMGLLPGDQFSIGSLLHGLLIPSGNDAAVALAEAISGSEEAFVELMNQRAEMLGLTNTHFTNTTGFDDEDHYSSSLDMTRIVSLVFQHPELVDIMKLQKSSVTTADGKRTLELTSTNHLFNTPYAPLMLGGKTGTTVNAKQCLLEVIENEFGKRLIIAVIGSDDRYRDMVSLIDFQSSAFRW